MDCDGMSTYLKRSDIYDDHHAGMAISPNPAIAQVEVVVEGRELELQTLSVYNGIGREMDHAIKRTSISDTQVRLDLLRPLYLENKH
jgi:hypothetical protein